MVSVCDPPSPVTRPVGGVQPDAGAAVMRQAVQECRDRGTSDAAGRQRRWPGERVVRTYQVRCSGRPRKRA
ncbi:hypothetical protein TPA0907_12680 [Micromonospora humidisoli]|nr:hypothetical protein TPA0907_12680 [Micromonospora sp. AKA109]